MLIDDRPYFFRTPAEALVCASRAAPRCADDWRVAAALGELLTNAVEHGNLEIGFALKRELLERGAFDGEILARLAMSPYRDRRARLICRQEPDACTFLIEDDGPGFDWRHWCVPVFTTGYAASGRGIALAMQLSGGELRYAGCGNRVSLRVACRQGCARPELPAKM